MGNSFSDELTIMDLEMIEISWTFVKDKQDLGITTMIKIFEFSNEIKNMFKFASNLNSGEEMSENPRVRYHANQVIRTLNKIIIVISRSQFDSDSNSCIALLQDQERLFEQGERHYHYGLKVEHFTVFENCFIKSLEESLKINTFHEKYEISWRKLLRYIFKQFTDGMKFEKKEELKLEKQKSLEKQKTLEKQISLKQQKSMDKPTNF